MDDDNAADQHTMAADDIGATTVAPPSTDAAAELAWSRDDDDETVSVERQSWGLAWAQAALFVSMGAVFALVIGAVGWALMRTHDDSPQATPVAQRAAEVTQSTHPEAPAVVVAPSTVTVEALHVVEDGRAAAVATTPDYPSALAAIQTWTPYLTNGGTVAAWLENSQPAQPAIKKKAQPAVKKKAQPAIEKRG
jgi:hypothetical protein